MYSMHNGGSIEVFKQIAQRVNPKTVVEVGTYYGGITKQLSELLPYSHFFAVQAYKDSKLNHMPDTARGEYSQGNAEENIDPKLKNKDWKRSVKKYFPEEYHDYYDFNLLAGTFQDSDNVTLILDTSPFKYDWKIGFDLVIFDISPEIQENIRQFDYWKKYGNKDSYILMGAYTHQKEFFEYAAVEYSVELIGKDYVLVRL